ncbi:tRNA pseudouridine(55) synthase TruB [Clostridium merdae]|uniref:tRNA pseudouridine(55) synthase TruB n=1 Tax=Clostridium merdae TaxID=1958780 RepID=UPI000A26EB4A|nr:tRNA pseudouridine(55) synthase TruB [Clostridium merdae]
MDGVLIIDKPCGFTSFDVVAVARRLCREKKIGHTGTLDPMATGVLPLLLGKATRAASLLEDSDKVYCAVFRLGVETDTQDNTGEVLRESNAPVSRAQLEEALPQFRGEIMQTPPMYSAVRKDGKHLYELARQGIEVERESRPVTIYRLELLEYNEQERQGSLLVECSKGTYIRTLCADLGQAVGSLGIMTALRRTRACGFSLEQALPLEEARSLAEENQLAGRVLSVESLFLHLPQVSVTAAQSVRFQNGGALALERLRLSSPLAPQERVRVYSSTGEFLGLGQANAETQELAVLRLFCSRTGE